MKNSKTVIFTPIFVSVLFFLMTLSEKLLKVIYQNSGADIVFSSAIVQLFIFAIPAAFFCKVRGMSFPEKSGMKKVKFSFTPFIVASSFTYILTVLILLYVQYNFISSPSDATSILSLQDIEPSPHSLLLNFVIVPAIVEEFFFRSIIISDYKDFGGPVAVTVSALFFAMLHFSFESFLLYFSLGVILGTVTFVTGSTFPSFFIHLINNLVSVYFGDSIGVFLKESSSSIILVFLLVVIFMAAFSSMLSSMEDIYEKRSALFDSGELEGSRRTVLENTARAGRVDKKKDNKRDGKQKVFLSPTFLFTLFLFLLITLDVI
ncbi:MAG: CPBP family intramembrane metalloprotease [Ruminococcaceae bacterium]|nr:CPBP family intramembrane metalloprotease [Oscillospiraceae bacterium]